MKALVTGGAGFIGGAIARGLVRAGYAVSGWDRREVAPGTLLDGAAMRCVDLLDAPLERLLEAEAPTLVVHAAGPASVANSIRVPSEDFTGSLLPWQRLLEALRVTGQRPLVVYISSAAVYGEPLHQPISEGCKRQPLSPYGFHRYQCELLGEEYASQFGLDVAVGRLFSTFGYSQKRLLVWELFAKALGAEEEVVLEGTGNELRDYLFEEDLAVVVEQLAAFHPRGYSAWNLATGHSVTTRELAERIVATTGKNKPVRCRGIKRQGEPERWLANSGQIQSLLGERKLVSLEEGLKRCAEQWATELCGGQP